MADCETYLNRCRHTGKMVIVNRLGGKSAVLTWLAGSAPASNNATPRTRI